MMSLVHNAERLDLARQRVALSERRVALSERFASPGRLANEAPLSAEETLQQLESLIATATAPAPSPENPPLYPASAELGGQALAPETHAAPTSAAETYSPHASHEIDQPTEDALPEPWRTWQHQHETHDISISATAPTAPDDGSLPMTSPLYPVSAAFSAHHPVTEMQHAS